MKLHTKTAPVNYFNEQLEISNYINTEKPNYYPVLKLIQQASYVHNGFNGFESMKNLAVAYNHMFPNETAVIAGSGTAFLFTRTSPQDDFINLGFIQPQEAGTQISNTVCCHDKFVFLRSWKSTPDLTVSVEVYLRQGNSFNHVQTIDSHMDESTPYAASSISASGNYLAITGMEEGIGHSVTIYFREEGVYKKQAVIPMNICVAKHVHLFDGGKGLMVVEDDDVICFYTRKNEKWTHRMSTMESYIPPKKYSLTLSLV